MKYIPHIHVLIVFAGLFFYLNPCRSQSITYSFGAFAGAFAYNATPTVFPELPAGIDDGITNSYPIGFNFQYGCQTKTDYIVSSNGWLTFNTGCIGSDPGNQLAGNATQISNAERPIIAPLWDDLDVDAAGNVNRKLTGTSPNQVLTIEWKKMRWRFSATGPVISFQVKLYETSNRIDFVYIQESAAVAGPGSASSGLTGAANGNYYSLQSFGASPVVTNNTGENVSLSAKPASSQTYSWSPTCGLPIELIYFTGDNDGESDLFNWATATETNNDFFTIEGSANDIDYTELKKIKSAGNSHSSKHYQCKLDLSEYTYFRLKQTDINKLYSYSRPIAIDNSRRKLMKAYPVPADKTFFIEDAKSYVLYDATGRELKRSETNNKEEIDVSGLKEGLYLICLDEGNFFKVIVQH